eukprot:scaffold141_cov410-Prasinococcus_capsulatus_cf.AAC.9
MRRSYRYAATGHTKSTNLSESRSVSTISSLGSLIHASGVKNQRTDAARASSGVVVRQRLAPEGDLALLSMVVAC